jgi:hypothetical protein
MDLHQCPTVHSHRAAELRFTWAGRLRGDVDGDGRAELRIQLLEVKTFAPSGSAEPEAKGSPRIEAARTLRNGCTWGVIQPAGSGLAGACSLLGMALASSPTSAAEA